MLRSDVFIFYFFIQGAPRGWAGRPGGGGVTPGAQGGCPTHRRAGKRPAKPLPAPLALRHLPDQSLPREICSSQKLARLVSVRFTTVTCSASTPYIISVPCCLVRPPGTLALCTATSLTPPPPRIRVRGSPVSISFSHLVSCVVISRCALSCWTCVR